MMMTKVVIDDSSEDDETSLPTGAVAGNEIHVPDE